MNNENKSWWNRHPVAISVAVIILLALSARFSISTQTSNEPIVTQEDFGPTSKPISRDIRVTFQTVKKVDGKYRYFFDIRNHDSVPFSGSVEIKLTKNNGSVLGQEILENKHPIEPNLGDSIYFDINTGTTPDFDPEYAISGFEFRVIQGGEVVASGRGNI